jgi:hypothetical protein
MEAADTSEIFVKRVQQAIDGISPFTATITFNLTMHIYN